MILLQHMILCLSYDALRLIFKCVLFNLMLFIKYMFSIHIIRVLYSTYISKQTFTLKHRFLSM